MISILNIKKSIFTMFEEINIMNFNLIVTFSEIVCKSVVGKLNYRCFLKYT